MNNHKTKKMKKVILIFTLVLGIVFSVSGQRFSKNALGLRLGSNDGFGAEVSYQRKLSKDNRLELDLGWRNSKDYDAFKIAGLYQWVMEIENNFNWYAGAGGGLGSWSLNNKKFNESGTFLFLAGDIGVEYNFDIPLQISLDFRPELYLGSKGYRDGIGSDIGLGIRYKF